MGGRHSGVAQQDGDALADAFVRGWKVRSNEERSASLGIDSAWRTLLSGNMDGSISFAVPEVQSAGFRVGARLERPPS